MMKSSEKINLFVLICFVFYIGFSLYKEVPNNYYKILENEYLEIKEEKIKEEIKKEIKLNLSDNVISGYEANILFDKIKINEKQILNNNLNTNYKNNYNSFKSLTDDDVKSIKERLLNL